MDSRSLVDYCLTKLGATEDYPFGPDVIVIKFGGKMFALFFRRGGRVNLSLKCDPDYAELLRRQHAAITPGYHLNKRHWITLLLDGSLGAGQIRELISHSYQLVAKPPTGRRRTAAKQKTRSY
jgi:predicted DNA-binding protein (MmcQ/YjbR family)